jgi:putative hydrolase of the HAD superfamily
VWGIVQRWDVYGVRPVRINAVFFDSGHTLMRPRDGRWFPGSRFFEICTAHGNQINDDERLRTACDTGYEFLAAHHDQVPDLAAETRQFDEYYRIVLDALGAQWTDELTAELAAAAVNEVNFEPYPTTASLLDELAARGVPMAVITDAWPSIRHKYALLGFLDYFSSFVISAEVGCTKPDFDIFRPALDALQVAPNDVLFIDDGPEIVAGASRLGFVAHQIDLETATVPLTTHRQILDLLDA